MEPAPEQIRRRTRTARAVPVLALVAALCTTLSGCSRPVSFHGTAYDPPQPAANFQLVDQNGHVARLSDYRGKTVLLYFGYTNCPDVCPITLSKLQRTLDELHADPDQVRVLFVTVDPSRDTPAQLARYVAHYGGLVTGLSGSMAQLSPVYKAYGIYAHPDSTMPARMHHSGPLVSHSDVIFGIDRTGEIRVLLHGDAPDSEFADDVRTLLQL